MSKPAPPTSFRLRLSADLDKLEAQMDALLDASTIRYVNPNTPDSWYVVIGAADWGWGPSDDAQSHMRMDLSANYEEWMSRFATLLRRATPEISKKVKQADAATRKWLARNRSDTSIPQTIIEAKVVASRRFGVLREALRVLGEQGDMGLQVVPDTSALMGNPDLASYAVAVGSSGFTVRLLPHVLTEIDQLKDTGRTPEVRDRARAVTKRIKGLRDHGQLTAGVQLTKTILVVAETREPNFEFLPKWLDPSVPDDRILAGALELQAQHPAATVVLVASDMNIQNKAEVAGLPSVEPPELDGSR